MERNLELDWPLEQAPATIATTSTSPSLDTGESALPRQLPILDAMRLIGFGAQAALAIGLVVLVVALEPHDLAVPFEREHVRSNTIEEPPIVADDDGAAGKG